MDSILLIVGRVALLLLYFRALCCKNETMCTYEYLTQSAKATCTPVAPPDLCLELICQVNGSNNNFTIQWHYSSSSSPSSQDSISSVENVIGNDSETVLEIRQSKLSSSGVISTLVLKYDIQAAGYYWCTVMNASYPTPNPSQVLNISTSLFNGDATTSLNLVKCNGSKSLFDTPRTIRCANHNMSIDAQLGSCATAIVTFPDLESTILPSSVLIVGIAFALLIAIIIIVLIAIVYLNHKKKKIKVSSMSQNHIHNPCVKETSVSSTDPDRKTIKTSSSVSALHTPPEEVSTVKVTIEEDSINVTQRDEYEMIEIDEQSEYSHVHGGSIRSPGTALSPSTVHCQGKLPITSFLSMSGRQSEPIFDSPVYTTIELDGSILTNSRPTTGEGVTNADSGYSHINGEDIPTESTNDVKFPMMSTGEQYVSELGHIYHLLERSRQNRSTPDSNEGSPNFQIIEDDSVKDRKESDSILPYSVVNGSPNQDSNKQKKTENNEDHSDSSSLQDSSMESSHKVIPLYSQVDKSKKKNRQLDQFDHQETQVIEQKSVDKIDSEKEGLTYHTIDHEP